MQEQFQEALDAVRLEGQKNVEQVKRKIIQADQPVRTENNSFLDMIKELTKEVTKDQNMTRLVFDQRCQFFEHLPSFNDVFGSVAKTIEDIRSPLRASSENESSCSNFPASPNSVLDEIGDDFSLPPI